MLPDRFIIGLGAAVTIVWSFSCIAEIVSTNYHTPLALHGMMGTIVGAVFTEGRIRTKRRQLLAERDLKDLREEGVNDG
jgi:hypothetical protein